MVVQKQNQESLALCNQYLQQNLPIIVPCDTIYGFVGKAPESDNAIRQIKGRSETNPFLCLISSPDISFFSDTHLPESISALWPAPLTLIVKVKAELVKKYGCTTLAVRYPDDLYLIEMTKAVGGLLYSTSCNRSGNPPMTEINDIIDEFSSDVPLIVDGGIIDGKASTLLDITTYPYKILRQGTLEIDNILLK